MERFLNLAPVRFLRRFSYRTKLVFATFLFLLALLASSIAMSNGYNRQISNAQLKLHANQFEQSFRSLVSTVLQHQLMLKHYQRGDKEAKGEILKLQTAVLTDLDGLLVHRHQREEFQEANASNEEENLLIQELVEQWQMISRRAFEVDIVGSDAMHDQFLQRLERMMLYFNVGLGERYIASPALPPLLHVCLVTLPRGENLIVDILEQVGIGQNDTNDGEARQQLRAYLSRLNENLHRSLIEAGKGILVISNNSKELQDILQDYSTAVEAFVKYGNSSDKEYAIFLSLGEKALAGNFTLRDALFQQINLVWEQLIESLHWQLRILLWGIGASTLLAFFLVATVMLEIYVPLKDMGEKIDSFSKGNLSSRAKIYFSDEIGRVGMTLNTIAEIFEGLIRQLHRTGIQLTTSTTEIAAAAKQQEVTVVEQEATTKEIAVTANEILTTAKEFAKTMNSISQTAEQASSLAASGKEGLSQMESTMRLLVEASGNIASRLGILNEKASGITNVVTTIAKVADQTNLLSLNASIEAEKAGEMGRSFGVIAREIRRLADQTANATVDIEKMVSEMVSAVSGAVMGVDKFSEEIRAAVNQVNRISGVLSQIIEQVQGLTISFENVNRGMQNQTVGAEEINKAISQLSSVAQETSESIRQFQNAIEQLNIAARDMQASAAKVRHDPLPHASSVGPVFS